MPTLSPNSAFARQVRALALDKIAEFCQPIATDAARRADVIVTQLYDTTRSGYRSKNNSPLLGSFTGHVKPSNGDFPVEISLRSSCEPAKLWSLEHGSAPHEIRGNGKLLVFPEGGPTSVTTQGPRKRTRSEFGETGSLVHARSVQHPGTKGGRFMEQALASAIQARLRLSRGLTVGGR